MEFEILRCDNSDVPEVIMNHFENRKILLISENLSQMIELKDFFIIKHPDGRCSYMTQMIKPTNKGENDQWTYIAEYEDKKLSGYIDIIFALTDDIGPFISFSKTIFPMRCGRAKERLLLANYFCKQKYNMPLCSGFLNDFSRNLWNSLFKLGIVEKYTENNFDYRFIF